jgi:hypothetical protein
MMLGAFVIVVCASGRASTFSSLTLDFLGRGGPLQGLMAGPGDDSDVVWTPSGLAFGSAPAAFASYMDYLVDVRGGALGYRARAGRHSGYGLFMSYLSSGAISRTSWDDPVGGTGGTFGYRELVAGLSGGISVLRGLSLGTAVKLARQELDSDVTSGAFFDLSSTYRVHPLRGAGGNVTAAYLSLATRNIEVKRWGLSEGDAPLNTEVGLGVQAADGSVSAGFSFYFARAGRREVRAGFSALPSEEFEVRLGYRRRTGHMADRSGDLPWERGITVGFSVSFGAFWLDYTYEDASPLDNIHRFALRTRIRELDSN